MERIPTTAGAKKNLPFENEDKCHNPTRTAPRTKQSPSKHGTWRKKHDFAHNNKSCTASPRSNSQGMSSYTVTYSTNRHAHHPRRTTQPNLTGAEWQEILKTNRTAGGQTTNHRVATTQPGSRADATRIASSTNHQPMTHTTTPSISASMSYMPMPLDSAHSSSLASVA